MEKMISVDEVLAILQYGREQGETDLRQIMTWVEYGLPDAEEDE